MDRRARAFAKSSARVSYSGAFEKASESSDRGNAGGQFHAVAVAVRGQQLQVDMATVHSNSGNIFLNPQGILTATYLAVHGSEI